MKSDKQVYVVMAYRSTESKPKPIAVYPNEQDALNHSADENEKKTNLFSHYVEPVSFFEAY